MSFEELLYMTRSQISWQELANKTVKCKSWSAKKKTMSYGFCPFISRAHYAKPGFHLNLRGQGGVPS